MEFQEAAGRDSLEETIEDCVFEEPGITVLHQIEADINTRAALADPQHSYSTEYGGQGVMAHDQISILSLD